MFHALRAVADCAGSGPTVARRVWPTRSLDVASARLVPSARRALAEARVDFRIVAQGLQDFAGL